MVKGIKIIAFDLDDTLYNEIDFVQSGFRVVAQYVAKKFGLDKNELYSFLTKTLKLYGRGKIFDVMLKKYGIYDKKTVTKLVGVYRSHKPEIKLAKNIKKTLKNLKNKYKLALITDGDKNVQRNKVHALKLNDLLDCIVYTDDYGPSGKKPSAISFKKVLKELGGKPEEMIYVGDNPEKDFIGAKKIGIKTVQIYQDKVDDNNLPEEFTANYSIKKIENLARFFI